MPDKLTTLFTKKISRRDFLRSTGGFFANHWLLSLLPLGGAGLLGWAEHDTKELQSELWDLFYPKLPTALEGKTICQLSDLHLESLQMDPERIRQTAMAQKPDLIVLTGDIISTRIDLDKVNPYLNKFSAPYGNYVVLGNNDYSHLSHTLLKRFLKQLEGLGWIPLLNQSTFLSPLNLWIIGIDDPATAHDDVDRAYQNLLSSQSSHPVAQNPSFRLALAHSSDCLDDVASYGSDLLLTGHTHGGQIRLPGFRPLITNTYLGDKGIYEGYHVVNETPLYINRGIGESVIPLRFNVPPEIAFFTLHRGNKSPLHQVRNAK
ncbi:putative phosphohydrolase [Desulfosporosinus acidiphilus SJ4]|uniref:Putative phosphohydrolase n=1 Tax=Desulfosporosinus acidiphilus (strain DSM 22704 / JCM 16185 / SJ4) TaxID=646529 RepID=I4DBR3_DESAJ|nr:metallophosphoesterase [Desulfosporosinus acidiphilus]AFM43237.1 putative phosphohydrolase [Desulfosporosinus acidiphilus SJ4]